MQRSKPLRFLSEPTAAGGGLPSSSSPRAPKSGPQSADTLRRKAAVAFIWFFVFMILFTLLSRAVDAKAIARVSVGKVEGGMLDHSIQVQGEMEALVKRTVSVPAGIRLASVDAQPGKQVKAGEVLATLDLEDLTKQLQEAKDALTLAQLQKEKAGLVMPEAEPDGVRAAQDALRKAEAAGWEAEESARRAVQRAQEDLDNAREQVDKAKASAGEQEEALRRSARETAQRALDAAESAHAQAGAAQEASLTPYKRAVEDAHAAVAAAQAAGDAAALEQANLALQRAQEDLAAAESAAQRQLEQAQRNLAQARQDLAASGNGVEAPEGGVEAARSQVKAAERALDDAKWNLEKQLTASQQDVLDAQAALERAREEDDRLRKQSRNERRGRQIDAAAQDMEIKKKQEEVDRLQALVDGEGKILSPLDGTALEVPAQAGQSGGGAILLADAAGGCRFRATLSKELEKYVEAGDNAMLTLPDQSQQSCMLESKSPEGEGAAITATLPAGKARPGQKAKLATTRRSKNYGLLVPLGALHRDNQGDYVLALRATQGVLGEQIVAERVAVTVLDKDNKFAAVQGGINPGDQVILGGNKAVEAGDRVRLDQA